MLCTPAENDEGRTGNRDRDPFLRVSEILLSVFYIAGPFVVLFAAWSSLRWLALIGGSAILFAAGLVILVFSLATRSCGCQSKAPAMEVLGSTLSDWQTRLEALRRRSESRRGPGSWRTALRARVLQSLIAIYENADVVEPGATREREDRKQETASPGTSSRPAQFLVPPGQGKPPKSSEEIRRLLRAISSQ